MKEEGNEPGKNLHVEHVILLEPHAHCETDSHGIKKLFVLIYMICKTVFNVVCVSCTINQMLSIC